MIALLIVELFNNRDRDILFSQQRLGPCRTLRILILAYQHTTSPLGNVSANWITFLQVGS